MQPNQENPLVLSDPALLKADPLDRWLVWVPIIGWIVGGFRQYARIGRAIDEVIGLLRRRDAFSRERWQDEGLPPELAERVAKAIANRITWLPNHHFLPEDPLKLLLLDEDGMGFFEADFAIQTALGIKLRFGMQLESFRDLVAQVQSALASR
jgi:hypothetical protein